jgi:hypothetical protein
MTDEARRLLEQAFRVLGKGPSRRELGLVADTLRSAGEDVVAATENFDELAEIALASGASGFVALDLRTAVAYGVESVTAGPPSGKARR